MTGTVARRPLSQIVFDEALYPRKEHDPALVQRYTACLEAIEAAGHCLAITQAGCLLDGKHRWLAYRTRYAADGDPEIPVRVYDVTTPHEQFALAVELNSQHGYQLTVEDKKQCAIRMYEDGYTYETIAAKLSVSKSTVADFVGGRRDAPRPTLTTHHRCRRNTSATSSAMCSWPCIRASRRSWEPWEKRKMRSRTMRLTTASSSSIRPRIICSTEAS